MNTERVDKQLPDSERVIQVIKESEDLVTALEAVGAMYGIPAENIICDDKLSSIKVVGDNISAPPLKNTTGNTKAIICSIGGVLDYISQRIDDKLDAYQRNNIATAKHNIATSRTVDLSKGNVIGRYRDANGDEIIAYDTGYFDSANTPEATRKVEELRQQLNLTDYTPKTMTTPTYFNDEDDITAGLDIVDNMTANAIEPVDISSDIQESAFHIDLVSKYHDTRNLGYDIFSEMGFDFVKPIEVVQESASKDKSIDPKDISHMKFDNTNIIKAIDYMNKARADQEITERGKFSAKLLINNENWQKAIDCLNKQFNARINIRFINNPDEYSSLYTSIWYDIKTNLSVSKSKGFQLNGLPIDIFVINKSIDEEMPKNDPSMFGQFVISGLLHEIFHNIAAVMRENGVQTNLAIASMISLAVSTDSAKNRRVIITEFVNTMDEFNGKKMNLISRRKLIKNLLFMTTMQHDEIMLTQIKKSIDGDEGLSDREIDDLIEKYEKLVKKLNKQRKRTKSKAFKIVRMFTLVIGAVLTCTFVGAIIGIPLLMWSISSVDDAAINRFRSEKHMEEFYCDMFAGVYQLPFAFLIGKPGDRSFTANSISKDKLNKLASLEKEFYELVCATYPTAEERTYSAVVIAKKLLENEDLDPAIKKYCGWIVENHSNILDTDIATNFNDNTFDPKTAENLDEHIQNIITNNNVTVTEHDVSMIFSDNEIISD